MHVGNTVAQYDTAVDMTGLNRIVDYRPPDLVVVAEAGMTIAALQAELGKNNQRLPFNVQSADSATIGGSLASNTVGPLSGRYGGVRDLVIGMSIVESGEINEGPEDPDQWPYKTVLEAMNDGWRIIKFPDMTLMLQDEETYGLGCDFVLEKWE